MAQIKKEIRDLGLPCTASIAGGPVTAKVAVETAKPDGLIEVAPGEEKEFLAPLAIELLPGVGPTLGPRLRRMGIRILRDIQDRGEAWWRRRWGEMGLDIYLKSLGIEEGRLWDLEPAKSYSRETTFPKDVTDRARLSRQLSRFVEEAVYSLRRDGRSARTATLKIRYGDFKTHTYSATREAGDDESIWWPIARALMEKNLQPGRSVRLIGFKLSSLADGNPQPELFGPSPERQRRLAETVDRLRGRFGREVLHRGSSIDAPDPEEKKSKS